MTTRNVHNFRRQASAGRGREIDVYIGGGGYLSLSHARSCETLARHCVIDQRGMGGGRWRSSPLPYVCRTLSHVMSSNGSRHHHRQSAQPGMPRDWRRRHCCGRPLRSAFASAAGLTGIAVSFVNYTKESPTTFAMRCCLLLL